MVINVNKEELFGELFMLSEYVADKSGDYHGGVLIDENRELLDCWWSDSCNSLLLLLRYWLVDVVDSENSDFNINITLINNDLANQSNINSLIANILLNDMLSKWLIMIGSAQATVYSALTDAKIMELRSIVYFRKPVSYEKD